MPDKARQVLQAALVEARGSPGRTCPRLALWSGRISTTWVDLVRTAEYLDKRRYTAEEVNDYEFFVLTLEDSSADDLYQS